MARGRKPKEIVLTGVPSVGPTCPKWIGADAKKEWNRVAAILEPAGIVHEVDLALLTAYCVTFVRWRATQEKLDADGLVGETGKLHPLARLSDVMLKQLRGLIDQLGFSPVARRQVIEAAAGDADVFESTLGSD